MTADEGNAASTLFLLYFLLFALFTAPAYPLASSAHVPPPTQQQQLLYYHYYDHNGTQASL